jgi:hypothetical protein
VLCTNNTDYELSQTGPQQSLSDNPHYEMNPTLIYTLVARVICPPIPVFEERFPGITKQTNGAHK